MPAGTIDFQSTVDRRDLSRVRRLLSDLDKVSVKATRKGLTKAAKATKIESKERILRTFNYKKKAVRDIKHKAAKGNSIALMSSEVNYGTSAVPLSATKGASQTQKGVRVKVRQTRELIPSAFIARVKAVSKKGRVREHRGVFIRYYKPRGRGPLSGKKRKIYMAPHKGKDYRLRIKQLYTVKPIDWIHTPANIGGIESYAMRAIIDELMAELRKFGYL